MTLKLCTICGEPCEGSRCPEHPAPEKPKGTPSQRGYTASWAALSRRARQLQPWCTDCGTKDDLTGDHLTWPARTLKDLDVVCRSCNSKRGAVRHTETTTGEGVDALPKYPRAMAEIPTHSRPL